MGQIDQIDLSQRIGKAEYAQRLVDAQRRLLHLRLHLGGQMGSGELGPALLVVFEGRDAAGKGGSIKRLVEPLDPRHYRVTSYAKPTPDEKRHHFLRRFYREIPGIGGMAVFDRSWYGRVLVERIEGFATDEQWRRAYDEIVSFERTLVLEGMILVKIWLHISDEEQLRRFDDRAADPLRTWKITQEDWRNRKRNSDYDVAAEEMFARTHHPLAPWDVISGEQKRLARVQVIEAVNRRIEDGMRHHKFKVPPREEIALLDQGRT